MIDILSEYHINVFIRLSRDQGRLSVGKSLAGTVL